MSRVLPIVMSVLLAGSTTPVAFAAANDSHLNFKIYSPDAPAKASPAAEEDTAPATETAPAAETQADAKADPKMEDTAPALSAETPEKDTSETTTAAPPKAAAEEAPAEPTPSKAETPAQEPTPSKAEAPAADTATDGETAEKPAATDADGKQIANKVLQGYVRVVPTGTKIPIIMDTAVDSDTSQEGDEFEARTAEDLTIDGNIAVPAGSVIKGRIAQLNAPKHLNRSGSVALKFDTVTTPDNRQIPIVANLVARGGVVHAKRGLKDIAIDTGTFALPAAAGLGIGLLAGSANSSSTSSSSGIGRGGGAIIGAGVGCAVGLAVLLAKRGKKVDVHPGDELKIELAEDLRMPMM